MAPDRALLRGVLAMTLIERQQKAASIAARLFPLIRESEELGWAIAQRGDHRDSDSVAHAAGQVERAMFALQNYARG